MYHIYTLESGEKVLVDEYFYNSYYDHDKDDHSMFPDSYEVLPVGRVIKGELDEELIEKLEEEGYQLSDTSFYVDMRGEFKDFSREDCEETAGVISFFCRSSNILPDPLRYDCKWIISASDSFALFTHVEEIYRILWCDLLRRQY